MKPLLLLSSAILLTFFFLGSASSQGESILFLGGQVGPTQGADPAVMTYLQERYGEQNVTYQQSNITNAGDEAEYAVLILSSTPGSGTMRNKFHTSSTPVVNWEEAIADNGGGEFMITAGRPKDNVATDHVITIVEDHPITAGFNIGQDVTISTGQTEVWWSDGQQAPGSLSLANEMGDPNRLFLTIVDKDGELNDGSFAPARRVMLGMTDNTFNMFTEDGKTLFGQAIDWALGISSEIDPLRITDVALDTSNPEASEVTLTWTSKVGKTYTVFANTELNDLNQWGDLDDSIEGLEGTTTETFAIPPGEPLFFFKVQENE